MKRRLLPALAAVLLAWNRQSGSERPAPGMVRIPAGSFVMGDHHGFADSKHETDELPLHEVRLDAFEMGANLVTTAEYAEYLNAALAERKIEVRPGGVYLMGGGELLCETRAGSPASRMGWDGRKFAVLDNKESHPMTGVRWHGAVAYCNWLSARYGQPACYDTNTWECDFNKSGFRLPTEAEWEYAARGGQHEPYFNYPWGDDADPAKANVPESRHPFRSGPQPWTTPVGYFGPNGYGLFDMAGNVWQWCTDWYARDYYSYSPMANPPGPADGSPMPDGKVYRVMRGGSWYNGEFGHGRVSNRDPSYYRGPDPATGRDDPDGPWFHVGFRVVRPVNAENRLLTRPTPARRLQAPGGFRGVRLLPREVEERLELSDEQRREIAAVEQDAGARLAKILTPDQRKELDAAPAPRRARGPEAGPPKPARRDGGLTLRSPVVSDGGALPLEFTGDGEGVTPPLEWSGAPAGTAAYALILHHTDPRGEYISYWIVYNIPARVQRLPKGAQEVGTVGVGSRGQRTGYTPPGSQGGGTRTYVFTLYALSAPVEISAPPGKVSHQVLLAAMQGKILASADLSVTHTRDGQGRGAEGPGREPPPRPEGPDGGRSRPDNQTPVSPNPGQTVGLFRNNPKSSPGYLLLAPKHNTMTYLLDNQGRIAHQWHSDYEPGQSVYLKANGNLLRACMVRNRGFIGGGEGGRIEEYDWNGKLIWEFSYSTDRYQQHHDIAPLPNGNLLMLVVEKKTPAESIAAGWPEEMVGDRELYPDSVVEIQPVYPNGGKVVWEWHVWDHLIQDYDKSKANYGDVAAHPERIWLRGGRDGPRPFWNHANSVAYNAKLDQIVISSRGNNEIWVVDHSTSTREAAGHAGGRHGKGGDLIYRWGNPAAYRRGTERDAQLDQQHDAQWVPDGYPGAGHITIFNNGYNRGYSSVEEIVPPVDATDRYILEPGKPYGPERPVWRYVARTPGDFFSSEISGTHRLPNGNTLICAGVSGHLFEVTAAGEMVWQYVNPVVRGGILAQGELPGRDVRGHLFNAVFKARRYAPDYPGLAGKTFTPAGLVELPAAQKGKTGLDRRDAGPEDRPPGDRKSGPRGPGGGKKGDRR